MVECASDLEKAVDRCEKVGDEINVVDQITADDIVEAAQSWPRDWAFPVKGISSDLHIRYQYTL